MVVAAASAMVCQFSSIKRFSVQRSGSSGSLGFLLLSISFAFFLWVAPATIPVTSPGWFRLLPGSHHQAGQ